MAWRGANVADLNALARAWMAATGRLTGPVLEVDGAAYRAGDRVVALAPANAAGPVTSQRATVTAVGPDSGTVLVRTEDDRQVTLGADQLGPDRLGHSYACMVYRVQGSTVDRAHVYADGGGRELAYVAMSRAWHASTAYVVADDLDQPREDLVRDWASRRTPSWSIDTALPAPDRASRDPGAAGEREWAWTVALRYARVRLLAAATDPGRPPARPNQAEALRATLAQGRQCLADVAETAGAYSSGPIGDAARHADTAGARLDQVERVAPPGRWSQARGLVGHFRRVGLEDVPRRWSPVAGRAPAPDGPVGFVGLLEAPAGGLEHSTDTPLTLSGGGVGQVTAGLAAFPPPAGSAPPPWQGSLVFCVHDLGGTVSVANY